MTQQRTGIAPAILQSFFESAANARDKGQAQFHTPPEFGLRLAGALPEHRPHVVDLNCGHGALLWATANNSTRHLLGVDIDPCRLVRPEGIAGTSSAHLPSKIHADLSLAYPLMHEVDWRAHLFVLNPPWDLWWYRDRLALLAESDLPAVRKAIAARDPRLAPGLIDATIATLLIALDRCTPQGEGFVIGNHATFERLIFAPDAPFACLQEHIWLRWSVQGNPMTGLLDANRADDFETGVLFFARTHTAGPTVWMRGDFKGARDHRQGAEVRDWDPGRGAAEMWEAVRSEAAVRFQHKPARFNVALTPAGTLSTSLSLFEQHSGKVDKTTAAELFELNGKTPMQLVLDRNQRDRLLRCCGKLEPALPWRCDPAVIAAVDDALRSYAEHRAPLYPLSDIQRLGFLDEEDWIPCKQDWALTVSVETKGKGGKPQRAARIARFQAGERYAISSRTVDVKRQGERCNLAGEYETLEFTGQELALFIRTGDHEIVFLDARVLKTTDRHGKEHPTEIESLQAYFEGGAVATLQDLVEHFTIPDVPDRATLQPEAYRANLARLDELEAVMA